MKLVEGKSGMPRRSGGLERASKWVAALHASAYDRPIILESTAKAGTRSRLSGGGCCHGNIYNIDVIYTMNLDVWLGRLTLGV